MAALRIEVNLGSTPDIGSGKSLLDAISRAPPIPKAEKREIHREARRGGRSNRVVVSAANASSMSYTEERVPSADFWASTDLVPDLPEDLRGDNVCTENLRVQTHPAHCLLALQHYLLVSNPQSHRSSHRAVPVRRVRVLQYFVIISGMRISYSSQDSERFVLTSWPRSHCLFQCHDCCATTRYKRGNSGTVYQ